MNRVLTISSVGDISLATGLNDHNYDFSKWLSEDVRNFMKSDLLIGNLECAFYPKGCKRPEGFNLSEQDTSVHVLSNSCFDVLNLANNHIGDYFGKKGIKHTIKTLDSHKIRYCGAGINIEQAQKPTFIERNGYMVGILGRMHESSAVENFKELLATKNRAGVAPLIKEQIIDSAHILKKKYNLDLLIMAVHWGVEHVHHHTSEIHKLADEIVNESEVDIILGSSSHCIQGIKKTDKGLICYGQGNFFFYPQKIDEGRLFDDKKDLNRTSIITRISLEDKIDNLSLDVKVVKQNKNNQIEFLSNESQKLILKNIFGIWAKNRKIALYFEYRLRALNRIIEKVKISTKNPLVRKKLYLLLLSPKKFIKKIFEITISSNYK